MSCTIISNDFRQTKYTVLIILTILALQIPLLFLPFNNTMVLFLSIFSTLLSYYISIFDPIQMCGKFSSDCKFKKFMLFIIIRIISLPLNYYILSNLFGDKKMTLIYMFITNIFSLGIAIYVLISNPSTLINHKWSVMRCNIYRIIVYSIILILHIFINIQIFKSTGGINKSDSASIYGVSSTFGYITLLLYFCILIYPVIMTIFTIDDAIKYDVNDLLKQY